MSDAFVSQPGISAPAKAFCAADIADAEGPLDGTAPVFRFLFRQLQRVMDSA